MIDRKKFISRMNYHWKNALQNTSNKPLRDTWGQISDAFNDLIRNDSDNSRRTQWITLSPKTGTGKTQSLIMYNVMLSEEYGKADHPGTLIVTRLKKDADDIANQINTLSKQNLAVAYHGDSKTCYTIEDLKESPVLVITHASYLLAVDHAYRNGGATWTRFNNYLDRSRKLIVIDEALDAVEEIKIDYDDVTYTHGSIPNHIYCKFPNEWKLMDDLIKCLRVLNESKDEEVKDRLITNFLQTKFNDIDLSNLRSALANVHFDRHTNRHDRAESHRLRMKHIDVLKNIELLLKSWVYLSKIENRNTLNSSRLVVPDGFKGAVVLDATARSDLIYYLFESVHQVISPLRARQYGNVTMKVSGGHRVGKKFMRHNAKHLCKELVNQLNGELSSENKVLVVTHMELEPILQSYQPDFTMSVAHWGAITGSNEYRDYDTVVIFGLPYRPKVWSTNTFAAYQGHESITDEWLQNAESRAFGEYPDIKSELLKSKLTVDTVQAINRIRCRKTVDNKGNCLPSTVYLLIPENEHGRAIVKGIHNEMPGIVEKVWTYKDSLSRKKPRKSDSDLALVSFAKQAQRGRYAISHVATSIDMSLRTVRTLTEKLKDETTELYQLLIDLGVSYQVEQIGARKRAYLVKS